MKAVMMSVRGREEARRRTLRSCSDGGIDVQYVSVRDDVPPGIENARRNARQALSFARDAKWPRFLFVEDDVLVSTRWREYESVAVAGCRFATALYVPNRRFYPARIKRMVDADRVPEQPEVVPLVDVRHFFGSQAIMLTRNAVSEILDGWEEQYPHLAFDQRLRQVCLRDRGRLTAVVPNLVQHWGAALTCTWSSHGKPHTSRTFLP